MKEMVKGTHQVRPLIAHDKKGCAIAGTGILHPFNILEWIGASG